MTTTAPNLLGKPWWQSRGVIGAVVVILGVILRHCGWSVDSGKLTDDISQVIEFIGGAVALYGRIKADQPIVWTRGTVPGGVFNPSAEVKKAIPVSPSAASAPLRENSDGSAVLQALCALAACVVVGLIFASCHPSTPEAGGKVEKSESGKVIRDPELPVVHHPDFLASAPSNLPTFYLPAAVALLRSLTVTPGVDIGTNSHGQTIYGPSITLRGGVSF